MRLYPRLLGPRCEEMAPLLREVHGSALLLRGTVTVRRGASLFVRGLAELAGLPRACADAPCVVRFEQREAWPDGTERWVREMAGRRFVSRLIPAAPGEFIESFGWYRFRFALEQDSGTVSFILKRFTVLGLPVPRALHPRVSTRESQQGEDYCFEIEAGLLGLGLLVAYQGRLRVAG
jgi:hypothetical protein